MDPAVYDELQRTLASEGPKAAIDRLCATLRDRKDYANLFYGLLLKKRHELGVSLIPTGPAQDLPDSTHEAYERGIREAGRLVGQLYLDEGDIPRAYSYFRMLGEPDPVVAALEKYRPGEEDDVQQVIEIAFHHGVHPRKGFDWIIDRFGICSAITTVHGHDFSPHPEVRGHCVGKLVRALHDQLRERLVNDVVRQEGAAPSTRSIRELMAGRDYLFADEFYHIDVSHLGAVVQMSIFLSPGEELDLARELCAYGERLSPRFQNPGDPPFDDQYKDYGVYLAAIAGENVEEGIAHFRAKVEKADPDTIGNYPAEVLVNLLLRLDRPAEALDVARKYLAGADERQLTCPGITELCRRLDDYRTLADVSRERDDPVHYMAGLISAANHKQ